MTRSCSICGEELADSPLAGPAHARKHRNRFERLVGRAPEDYDEVREFFEGEGELATLDDYAEGSS